ncbi:MAG TPA: CsbD family protein [Anaerolineae bacterium]|nr:CsbD family protein [Anaerolineae bacterium]
MNEDVMLRDQWLEIRGKMKEWWNKLTDDDLNVIDGHRDRLIAKLRERYGYSKEQAAKELQQHLAQFQRMPQTL